MSEEKYFYHCLGCNKLLLSEEERRNHKCDVGPNKNGDIFNLEWEKEYLTKYYKNLIKNRFGHTNKYTIENVIKNVKSYLETSELFTGRDLNKIEVFVDKQDPALVHIDIPVEYFHLMFSLNPHPLDTEVKMILPAGKYVISDPCYVLPYKKYRDLLGVTTYFTNGPEANAHGGIFEDPETKLRFCVFSTSCGDGVFYDNKGREYGVDAGCIGCIPYEMCEKDKIGQYSYIEEFLADFEVRNLAESHGIKAHSGNMFFGNIHIDTIYTEEDHNYEHDEVYEEDNDVDE